MKRKTGMIAVLLLFIIGCLTGCGNAIPEMTEEETRMVEEYAAQLILKYDHNYQPSVLTEQQKAVEIAKLEQKAQVQKKIEEDKKKQQENAQAEAADNADDSGSNTGSQVSEPLPDTDIDEFLELGPLSVEYSGYRILKSYPEAAEANDWQGITMATGNNMLIVFEYTITNTGVEDSVLDMTKRDVRYGFKLNDSLNKAPLTTLLLNDFTNYRDTILAGESKTAVLIVEVSPETAENLQSVQMNLKYNGGKGSLKLL